MKSALWLLTLSGDHERDAPSRPVAVGRLVERLWPHGLCKEKVKVDLWLEEMAPSHAVLRRWFHAAPEARWTVFQDYDREGMGVAATALAAPRGFARGEPVTLPFAASDETCDHAVVLEAVLEGEPECRRRTRCRTR